MIQNMSLHVADGLQAQCKKADAQQEHKASANLQANMGQVPCPTFAETHSTAIDNLAR